MTPPPEKPDLEGLPFDPENVELDHYVVAWSEPESEDIDYMAMGETSVPHEDMEDIDEGASVVAAGSVMVSMFQFYNELDEISATDFAREVVEEFNQQKDAAAHTKTK